METSKENTDDLSKELEVVNFQAWLVKYPQLRGDDNITVIRKGRGRRWTLNNKISPEYNKGKKSTGPKAQLEAFQEAMKILLMLGQGLGLNPVKGILDTDVRNMRFSILNWRFFQSIFIGMSQAIATILCLYRLLKDPYMTIGELGYSAFYAVTCCTTLLFIQIGAKWPKLMKQLSNSSLDEYVDPRVKFKCYTACVILITLATIEHLLLLLYKTVLIVDCHPDLDFVDGYLRDSYPWIFEMNVPTYKLFGAVLEVLNWISTLNWSYIDLFIVCMSIYLASILKQLNKKIVSATKKIYISSSYWRSLREDYSRATRLVRLFDDVISRIVFISFAANLFFVCLQIFNILAHGVKSKRGHGGSCANAQSGPFSGYEYTVYLLFSITYLFARYITVSLIAASVNTASLVPAPALYCIPSSAYCVEVSRFLDQVHSDTVALSGLQVFYVTRKLVLSMAGTIVTYELVLLQFSMNDMNR